MNELQRSIFERQVQCGHSLIEINTARLDREARETVVAAEKGYKFLCSRVRKYVDVETCADLFFVADEEKKASNPCWQCSKVKSWVKKKDIKRKVVKLDEQRNKTNPFDGWEKYKKEKSYSRLQDVFVSITKNRMVFSSALMEEYKLRKYKNIEMYFSQGKIGCLFLEEKTDSSFSLIKNGDSKRRTVSILGAKRAGHIKSTSFGKHTNVRKISDNAIEIILEKGK